MRRPSLILPPVLLLSLAGWFVGCGVDGPTSTTLPYPHGSGSDDDGGGSGGATSSAASGSTSSTSSTSGTTGSSSSASSSSAQSSASVSASSSSTGTGGGNDCSPDLDDGECVACAKDACCLEVQDCDDDASCSCWIGCIAETLGAIDVCIGECGLPGGALLELLDCAGEICDACNLIGI